MVSAKKPFLRGTCSIHPCKTPLPMSKEAKDLPRSVDTAAMLALLTGR